MISASKKSKRKRGRKATRKSPTPSQNADVISTVEKIVDKIDLTESNNQVSAFFVSN